MLRDAHLAALLGLLLLAQPVVGDGPGPDPRYTYEATPVDLDDAEAVETLYHHPAVAYAVGTGSEAVRVAVNGTYARPSSAVPPDLRRLSAVDYLADDVDDRYYRVDARTVGDEFRIDATRVEDRAVAEGLAVPPGAAPEPVRAALDGRATDPRRVNATLVDTEGGYALVRVVGSEQVPDPLAVPKVAAYAVGVVTLVLAGLDLRDVD